RAGRRRDPAYAEPESRRTENPRRLLARLPRSVGSEVAVARPARSSGCRVRGRSPRAQSGGDARDVAPDGFDRPEEPRVRAGDRAAAIRSGEGEATPD